MRRLSLFLICLAACLASAGATTVKVRLVDYNAADSVEVCLHPQTCKTGQFREHLLLQLNEQGQFETSVDVDYAYMTTLEVYRWGAFYNLFRVLLAPGETVEMEISNYASNDAEATYLQSPHLNMMQHYPQVKRYTDWRKMSFTEAVEDVDTLEQCMLSAASQAADAYGFTDAERRYLEREAHMRWLTARWYVASINGGKAGTYDFLKGEPLLNDPSIVSSCEFPTLMQHIIGMLPTLLYSDDLPPYHTPSQHHATCMLKEVDMYYKRMSDYFCRFFGTEEPPFIAHGPLIYLTCERVIGHLQQEDLPKGIKRLQRHFINKAEKKAIKDAAEYWYKQWH